MSNLRLVCVLLKVVVPMTCLQMSVPKFDKYRDHLLQFVLSDFTIFLLSFFFFAFDYLSVCVSAVSYDR